MVNNIVITCPSEGEVESAVHASGSIRTFLYLLSWASNVGRATATNINSVLMGTMISV